MFLASFSGRGIVETLLLGIEWREMCQISEEQNLSSALPKNVLDFRWVASFRYQSALKATEVENWCQISHFLTRCKIHRRGGRNVESVLPVQYRTERLIHF